MRKRVIFGSLLACGTAAAAPPAAERPVLVGKLVECRTILDMAARVACYDRNIDALDEAEKRRDVVIVDRQQIRRAKRSLFGFTLPHVELFDPQPSNHEEEPSRIEATLQSATRDGSGHWRLVLTDGARWEQIDTEPLNVDPKAGMAIVIRRAALGSYFANIAKQTAIRVRRVG